MKMRTTRTVLGLTVLLAACGQKSENSAAPAATEPPAAVSVGAMSDGPDAAMDKMQTPTSEAAAIMAHGAGTVTVIDKAAGTITLDHGAIPEAKWPAMTMAFKASPEVLGSVAVGDKVAFDLKLEGGSGVLTAIKKQ